MSEMIAAIDIETKDPHLKVWGPGSVRKDGRILGIGVYCPDLGVDEYLEPHNPRLLDRKSVV